MINCKDQGAKDPRSNNTENTTNTTIPQYGNIPREYLIIREYDALPSGTWTRKRAERIGTEYNTLNTLKLDQAVTITCKLSILYSLVGCF